MSLRTTSLALIAGLLLFGAAGASAQSPSAQLVADQAAKDEKALRAACEQGQPGITQLVTQTITGMIRGGNKQISPQTDGPAAGGILVQRCQTLR